MRRRHRIVLVAVAAALAAAATWAFVAHQRTAWTTDSDAALAAWHSGEDAMARLYVNEAAEHFAEALEHDPDFVMPKLFFIRHASMAPGGPEQVKRIIDELRGLDPDTLNPRERLILGYHLAHLERDRELARELLADYLDDHPDDPYAVQLNCDALWEGGSWGPATACYQRLIALDPNRVEAQNRIGYASMAAGDFTEAEAQFEIYRFLAPDQANPHDSLADLLTMTGRYDAAVRELRRALEIRADFCPAWLGLVEIALLERDFDAAEAHLEEARRSDGCPPGELEATACEIALRRPAAAGRWEEAWRRAESCGRRSWAALLAAAASGRYGVLEAEIERWRGELEAQGRKGEAPPASLTHVEALCALLRDGDAEAAVAWARQADDALRYLDGTWGAKLWNRLLLAEALERTGRSEEAGELRAEVARVNPRFAAAPPFPPPPAPAGRAER